MINLALVCLLFVCFLTTFSRPVCCSSRCSANTLEVLEANTLSNECANRPICQYDCPCRDPFGQITGNQNLAAHFDVTGTHFHTVYTHICTTPKIHQVRNFVNNIDPSTITEVFRNPRQMCGGRGCGGWIHVDGNIIKTRLLEFSNVLFRLCESGEVTSETPLEYLLRRWLQFLQKRGGVNVFASSVSGHREILENMVQILIRRCSCQNLYNHAGGDPNYFRNLGNQRCNTICRTPGAFMPGLLRGHLGFGFSRGAPQEDIRAHYGNFGNNQHVFCGARGASCHHGNRFQRAHQMRNHFHRPSPPPPPRPSPHPPVQWHRPAMTPQQTRFGGRGAHNNNYIYVRGHKIPNNRR